MWNSPFWINGRLVLSVKRARKLRKRGEDIRWSPRWQGWMWAGPKQKPSAEGDGNE